MRAPTLTSEELLEYRRLHNSAYDASPRGQKVRRAYRRSLAGRAAQARHAATPERREYRVGWSKTGKGRACVSRANCSPAGKARRKRYEQSHPEQIRVKRAIHGAVRRARKRASWVPGAAKVIAKIYQRAAELRRWFDVTVDHIIPLGAGFHEPANLQIIYRSENAKKGARLDYKPEVVFV